MQKSSTNHQQTKSSNTLRKPFTKIGWDLFQVWSSRVVQYWQISPLTGYINKREVKNHMNISIAEKAFDKVQHPFMIKTLNKVGLEAVYINVIKAIHEKSTLTSFLMGKNRVFPKVRNKTRMSALTAAI